MTLFGNSLCRCIRGKMRSFFEGEGSIIQYDLSPYKKRRGMETYRWKLYVMMEAEIEVIRLQAKECQGLPVTPEAKRNTFRGSMNLLTPWFQTFYIQNYKRINFCCSKPLSFWYFVPAILIQRFKPFLHLDPKSAKGLSSGGTGNLDRTLAKFISEVSQPQSLGY